MLDVARHSIFLSFFLSPTLVDGPSDHSAWCVPTEASIPPVIAVTGRRISCTFWSKNSSSNAVILMPFWSSVAATYFEQQ